MSSEASYGDGEHGQRTGVLWGRRGVDVDNFEHVELKVPVGHRSNCV